MGLADILNSPCFVAGTPVLVPGTDFESLIIDAGPAGNDEATGAGWYLVAAGIGIGLVVCEGGRDQRSSRRRRQRQRQDVFAFGEDFEGETNDDENCQIYRKAGESSGKINLEGEMARPNRNGTFVFEFTGANRIAANFQRPDARSGIAQADTRASAVIYRPAVACPHQTAPWLTPGRTAGTESRGGIARFQNSKMSNPGGSRRESPAPRFRWSRVRIVGGLLFVIACVARGLWGAAHDSAQTNRSAAAAINSSGPKHVAIEQIRVGQRVLTNGPFGEDAPSQTSVDPLTWRHLRLETVAFSRDGTRDVIEVETLQPPEWIARHGAQVGAVVPLPVDAVEMGFANDLRGTVLSNEECPRLQRGGGRIVQMTVNHLNRNVMELSLQSQDGRKEKLRPTAFHKFYSESRSAWIPAEDLRDGERLRGSSGVVTVTRLTRIPGIHRVYNMTVEAEHVYRVSSLGVLVHNNGCHPDIPGHPFTGPNAANDAFAHLEQYHGVNPDDASERLHYLKGAAGLGGADDAVIGMTGDVYNPYTGEWVGTLTQQP